MYSVKYNKDQCYYRGKVVSVLGKSLYSILFIDFGEIQITEAENISFVPSGLQIVPSLAVEVKLLKCSSLPLTEAAGKYVKSLISQHSELILVSQIKKKTVLIIF